ncbi:MAG: hypothetical protein JXB14_05825, partial [Candidatus Altiarchaeota archaeon]|nr:hypothetical protein [Candidatus Altiarchaeota archaeon]
GDEECDDGNLIDDDACTNDCKLIMVKVPVSTCTGDGELYLYPDLHKPVNPTDADCGHESTNGLDQFAHIIGTTFRIEQDRDQLLIFTHDVSELELRFNNGPTTYLLDGTVEPWGWDRIQKQESGVTYSIFRVDIPNTYAQPVLVSLVDGKSTSSNPLISPIDEAMRINAYLAQDSDHPVYDVDWLEAENSKNFVAYHSSGGGDSSYTLYLDPSSHPGDRLSCIYFDKYTCDKDVLDDRPVGLTITSPSGTVYGYPIQKSPFPSNGEGVVLYDFEAVEEGQHSLDIHSDDSFSFVNLDGYCPYCGDGEKDPGEQCDDGCLKGVPYVCEPADDGDGCDSDCKTEGCHFKLEFISDSFFGDDYTFDVLIRDKTNYNNPGCGNFLGSNPAYEIPLDMSMQNINPHTEIAELSNGFGTETRVNSELSISVPLKAGQSGGPQAEKVGTLHIGLFSPPTGPGMVRLQASAAPGESNDVTVIDGRYILIPTHSSDLCPVCEVQDVPYLLYYAAHKPDPLLTATDVTNLCDQINTAQIGLLESRLLDCTPPKDCPSSSFVFLDLSEKYLQTAEDLLAGDPTDEDILIQGARYCLEAEAYAKEGNSIYCAYNTC